MKHTKLTVWKRSIFSLGAAALIFSACKKNNDSSGSGISANIAGSSWQSAGTVGYYSPGSNGSGYFLLEGYKIASGDSSALEIDFADTAVVGKQYDFSSVGEIVYYDSKTDKYYGTYNNGSFKLTSWDKTKNTVTGDFSGSFYAWGNSDDSIVVTNGHFNTTYVTAP